MEQQLVKCVVPSPYLHATGNVDCNKWDSCGPASSETSNVSAYWFLQQLTCEPPAMLVSHVFSENLNMRITGRLPDGSPLSTCSSSSNTGSVFTPSCTDVSMHSISDSPVFQHPQFPPNSDIWSENSNIGGRPSNIGVFAWALQQLSRSYHGHSTYGQILPQSIRDYFPQLGSLFAPGCIPYHEQVLSSATGNADTPSSRHNLAISADVSAKDSSSEFDYPNCETDALLHELPDYTSQRHEEKSGIVELETWSPINYPTYTTAEPMCHECPLMDKNDPQSQCTRTFRRLGHLRRHIETVHGNERCHPCKVCSKPFARRDNLREHYWTHLRKGGRAGKNTKMSLLELRVILGPKERHLMKRLQTRLNSARTKEAMAKL